MSGQPNHSAEFTTTGHDINGNPRTMTLHLNVSPQELDTLKRNLNEMADAEQWGRSDDELAFADVIAHDLACLMQDMGHWIAADVSNE